jgi:phage shock protein A
MVSQIENHDAVVEAAIRESRQAVAKAKVRLTRVRSDGEQLQKKIIGLRAQQMQWTARARRIAGEDEEGALECLRRRKACLAQITQLEHAAGKHTQLEFRLTQDIGIAESKLSAMTQQRNLMRTRQSTAEALSTLSGMDDSLATDVASAFERWEVRVTESELETGATDVLTAVDALEHGFIEAEDRVALKAELQSLLAKEERCDDN